MSAGPSSVDEVTTRRRKEVARRVRRRFRLAGGSLATFLICTFVLISLEAGLWAEGPVGRHAGLGSPRVSDSAQPLRQSPQPRPRLLAAGARPGDQATPSQSRMLKLGRSSTSTSRGYSWCSWQTKLAARGATRLCLRQECFGKRVYRSVRPPQLSHSSPRRWATHQFRSPAAASRHGQWRRTSPVLGLRRDT